MDKVKIKNPLILVLILSIRFYQIFISLVVLLSPIIILIRLFKGKEHKFRFTEKFCFFSKKRSKGNLIWIHAASVGEFMSVVPLLYELEKNKINYKPKTELNKGIANFIEWYKDYYKVN